MKQKKKTSYIISYYSGKCCERKKLYDFVLQQAFRRINFTICAYTFHIGALVLLLELILQINFCDLGQIVKTTKFNLVK